MELNKAERTTEGGKINSYKTYLCSIKRGFTVTEKKVIWRVVAFWKTLLFESQEKFNFEIVCPYGIWAN